MGMNTIAQRVNCFRQNESHQESLHSPARLRAALGKTAVKAAIGAAVALGALDAGQAQALVVNLNGQIWNVTTFTGTYNDNTSKFATAANGGVMPWFGNQTMATQFADAVGYI